jgi:hypothetical protein
MAAVKKIRPVEREDECRGLGCYAGHNSQDDGPWLGQCENGLT